MAIANDKQVVVNILLENGSDYYGNIKYVMCPCPAMKSENYDKNKVMKILQSLEPCFSKTIGNVHKIEDGKVSNF